MALRSLSRVFRLIPKRSALFPVIMGSLVIQKLRQYKVVMAQTPMPTDILESFTIEKYEQYIKDDTDLIIFYDAERFMDGFQEEILQLVQHIAKARESKPKSRKLKILRLNKLSQEEQQEFEQKYNCYIEYDTILLLRNKYVPALNAFGAQEYFENKNYIIKYFEKLNRLSQKNFDKFQQILKFLPADNTVMMLFVNKNSLNYKGLQRRLAILQLQDTYSKNPNIHWFLIDEHVAKQMNIENPKEGLIYFMQKSTLINRKAKTFDHDGKSFNVSEGASLSNSRLAEVVDVIAEKYNQVNIFTARSFGVPNPGLQIVFECDQNKVTKIEWKEIVQLFANLKEDLKQSKKDLEIEYVTINKNLEDSGQKVRILIRDARKINDRTSEYSAKSEDELKQLSTYKDFNQAHSYVYQLDKKPTVQNLKDLIEEIQSGKAKEFFKSQSAPKARKFSHKLCGKNFKSDILDFPHTSVVFHYSKHCHACKTYAQFYEDLALESLQKKDSQIRFGRLNSDRNDLNCSANFAYTPVFEIFKEGAKDTPYVYRSQKFTPGLLRQFVEVTRATTLVEEKDYAEILKLKQYL